MMAGTHHVCLTLYPLRSRLLSYANAYGSKTILFDFRPGCDVKNEQALKAILRWLYCLISTIGGISPSYKLDGSSELLH